MIVYKTTNLINGKIYVGQDSHNDSNYLGSGKILKQAINKYGRQNFQKETLCECKTKEELNEKEIYWIKKLNSQNRNIGYNITDGGNWGDALTNNPNLEKIKKKISDSLKKYYENNPERIKILSEQARLRKGNKNSFYGKKHSEDSKKKMRNSNQWLNKKLPIEIKQKISNTLKEKFKGINNPCATKYFIKTPKGEIVEIISHKKVKEYLSCSNIFFHKKKHKGYILVNKIRINKNK